MRRRPLLAASVILLAAAAPFAPVGCSCSGETSNTTSGNTGGGGSGGSGAGMGAAGNTGTGGSDPFLDAGACNSGDPCGDGGVCAGNVCCSAAQACGEVCCGMTEVCSFQQCVTPGSVCHDSSECSPSEYCEYSLGEPSDAGTPDASCMGGAAELTGKCLPRPPTCAPDAGMPDGGTLTCLSECEFHPTAAFSPVLKFAWGGQVSPPYASDVMMTPVVLSLDDDDCDGKVTERDIPEIIFSTFSSGVYGSNGVLHAISIVGGQVVEKWNVPGVVNPTKQLAAGNFDGLPGNEIVACGVDGRAHAFAADGSQLWQSDVLTCLMPSIADLDGDGAVEVIIEDAILDGATGAVKSAFSPALNGSFVVSDIDGDGKLDVVTSSRGYHHDGQMFVNTSLAEAGMFPGTQDWKSPWPAIADFDKDGTPEIVVVDNLNHALLVWRYDAAAPQKFTVVRPALDINGPIPPSACPAGSWGNTHGGGPPTVADFNGDGVPDVGTAGGVGYAVFDGNKLIDPTVSGANTFLWIKQTFDCSSASTGSSVFDFDGDGKAEVVYSDQLKLRIYEGPTGYVLFETCNTTATLIEYPVIADVDNDGHADIVVVSNAYASNNPDVQCNDGMANGQSGVRVFGDQQGSWVRTRRVWNEHAYHVTNVGEDGAIPQSELPNWTQMGLNNFRQNKQPGSEFAAPDAIVSLAPACGAGTFSLVATVRNIGQAALPAGVVVGFYAGSPPNGQKLGEGTTSKVLYPAEAVSVTLSIAMPDPQIVNGNKPVYAVVDDGGMPHPSWQECRTDNNTSAAVSGKCDLPK